MGTLTAAGRDVTVGGMAVAVAGAEVRLGRGVDVAGAEVWLGRSVAVAAGSLGTSMVAVGGAVLAAGAAREL
jgi:hypothetical protein